MPIKEPIRCDQLPKESTKIVVQLLLEQLGYQLLCERDHVGASARYSLEKKGEPIPIVKANPEAAKRHRGQSQND